MKRLLGLSLMLLAGFGIGWMFAHPETGAWYLWAACFVMLGLGGGLVGTQSVFKKTNPRL